MDKAYKLLGFTCICLLVVFSSCRKEEMELIQAPDDQVLSANSVLASLMQRTAMNDGSIDNIIDKANCFNIQLPINVKANGQELNLRTLSDLNAVEYIFDTSEDDNDTMEIIFPITIVRSDYKEATLNSMNALTLLASECNGENESDSDIECLDFQFPITASVFNTASEQMETVAISNDEMLYGFVENLDHNDVVNIGFPIRVMLFDDTEISITNLNELRTTIEMYRNDCDEDDDFDYNDDDCNTCNIDQMKTILTACSNWNVDKLKRNNYSHDEAYEGYNFNFFEDGTVSAYWSGTGAYGTWSASGSGNALTVVINIPDLPYCNNNWILHEIQSYSGETRVDFKVSDVDRLRYTNNCN